jgi:hypothetical protein
MGFLLEGGLLSRELWLPNKDEMGNGEFIATYE